LKNKSILGLWAQGKLEKPVDTETIKKSIAYQKIDYRLPYLRLRDMSVNDRLGHGHAQLYIYYLAYVKNIEADVVLSYEDFKAVLSYYSDLTSSEVSKGHVVLPFVGSGKIQAKKKKLSAKQMLFLLKNTTKGLNPTDHSDGYHVTVRWHRSRNYYNNAKFRFIPSINMSKRVHSNIMDGNYNCYQTAKK
jgi:hypothetical protein